MNEQHKKSKKNYTNGTTQHIIKPVTKKFINTYTHTHNVYMWWLCIAETQKARRKTENIYIAKYKRKIPTLYYFGKYVE